MDASSAPAMTDGAIEVASQFSCVLRQDPPNKNRERGRYICKLGLDRSGPSWLSSIAVSMSARPAARREIKFMCKILVWNCSQKGVT